MVRRLLIGFAGVVALVAACTAGQDDDLPGQLQAGIATARMPAPLGIGTVGFGAIGAPTNPTPFSQIYPGTQRIHGHPEFKVVVLSRGAGHELVFLRSDTVGVFQQFRRAVVLELEQRMGRDFDDVVIMGATHTHSGPGRVIDAGGPFNLIADTFFPEFYEHMIDTIADAVVEAYDDLRPARIGHALASPGAAHYDRRCEDGVDYTNDDAPLLVVERDGQVDAILTSFAVHGTVLGIGELTLSQDVHGAIEDAVEDRFDHPVEVLLFNSWGADMAPAGGTVPSGGAPQPDGYERMEAVGALFADEVEDTLPTVAWSEDPVLDMRTYRIPIDRDHIGYEDDVFPYPYGAVFCGTNFEADCDPETVAEGIDHQCISFNDDWPAPNQTTMSVGRVGDWHFLTWPGEPGTKLSEQAIALAKEQEGVDDVWFFGYAQDYLGYSIAEDDWWQGGYEASGALWGPRQGEYLRDRLAEAVDLYVAGEEGRPVDEPAFVDIFDVDGYTPWVATPATDAGQIVADVPSSVGAQDVVTFTVGGLDPWLGAPVAYVERTDGAKVTRANGVVLDSNSYGFWVDLVTDPTYRQDEEASERAFHWTFSMPAAHGVANWPVLAGDYRMVVTLPDDTVIKSGTFTLE